MLLHLLLQYYCHLEFCLKVLQTAVIASCRSIEDSKMIYMTARGDMLAR